MKGLFFVFSSAVLVGCTSGFQSSQSSIDAVSAKSLPTFTSASNAVTCDLSPYAQLNGDASGALQACIEQAPAGGAS